MRKARGSTNSGSEIALRAAPEVQSAAEAEQLRQRLAELEAELNIYRSKH